MSPALFALAMAAPLSSIHARLQALSPACRVFSYLDDVMVMAPGEFAERAMEIVVEELTGSGLTVNADKTAAWTFDPNAPLPASVSAFRVPHLSVLGSTPPWMERDSPEAQLGVHAGADGARAVQAAEAFVAEVSRLRAAGLSTRAAFLLLQSF